MSDLKDNTNILTVINVSWIPELSHNLLNTILLARKDIEMFFRKTDQPSEIIVNKEIFDLANIIKNQYVIRLKKISKPVIVNRVTTPIIKTWHTWMGYLGYRSLLKLSQLVNGIKIKRLALTEICSSCIKGCLQ